MWRWIDDKGRSLPAIQRDVHMAVRYFKPLVVNRIKSQAIAQGMGRHSRSEVIEMGLKDLQSISSYLGSVQPALFDLEQMIIKRHIQGRNDF